METGGAPSGSVPGMSRPGRLCTVGYQGAELPELLTALRESGVELLCDVRADPVSRKPGFGKRALSAACLAAGLHYASLPELGIPAERRRRAKTKADRAALFAAYEREILPRAAGTVDRLAGWLRDGKSLALLCFEADPEDCHRRRAADAVARAAGVGVLHLRLPAA